MAEQRIDLGKISGKLGGKRGVWVNQRYEIGGEPATRACFIKKTNGRFNVGFDDYLAGRFFGIEPCGRVRRA
ncbi:hypothetical protein [Burkholderia ubonensis]|nr:hypothetical protein [Burkholderia ubonensis]